MAAKQQSAKELSFNKSISRGAATKIFNAQNKKAGGPVPGNNAG